jgi:hypothetical protein
MTTIAMDMSLVVNVTVSGTVNASNQMTISAAYSMASAMPMPGPGVVVVATNGDIDLTQMPGGTDFGSGTDIYFVLGGSVVGPTGALFPVFFQTPVANAVTITEAGGGGDSGIKTSFPGSNNTTMLLLDDLDLNTDTYNYTLHVAAFVNAGEPAKGNLDPAIVNRGS